VEAAPGYKTLAEVTMMDGAVAVRARDGALRVNDGGRTVEVAKGKTITVAPTSPVSRSYNVGAASMGLGAGAVGGAGALASALLTAEPTPPRPSPHQPPCLFPTARQCQ
jgi:hypothetical protein